MTIFRYQCTTNIMKVSVQSISQIVSWYFQPSQPQRISSGLKTMSNLFPFFIFFFYPARKSSNHRLSRTTKSVLTQMYRKHTQTSNIFFRRISPFGIAPVKKHIRLGHAGIVGHSVDLSIPHFEKKKVFKKKKKGMDRSKLKLKRKII